MNHYTKRDILRLVEEEDVEFIRLQFAELFGNLKTAAVTAGQLERVLDQGYVFDGSCVEGFLHDNDMDMFLWPDLATLAIFPWRPQQGKVARLICDIRRPDGTIYSADPRGILKRAVKHAKEMEYQFDVGPECEFFLFHTNDEGNPTTFSHEQAGFFDMSPIDLGENTRRDIILTLEEMGFEVEASYHEVAPAQHQIDFRYGEALLTADNIMTFKLAVKTIAKRFGLHATFMPKPRSGVDGSGMHINMFLLDQDGRNVFYDREDPDHLSAEGRHFMAGILNHISGLTALTNPLVNSYKRLVPGFEAPVYATWSAKTSFALLRVPPVIGENTRLELRSPDPTANPYLAFAACLAAGLEGMEKRLELPPCVDENVSAWTEEKRRNLEIERLPRNLCDAVNALEADPFLLEVIGRETARQYIDSKRKEWNSYRSQVTQWEIREYLNRY